LFYGLTKDGKEIAVKKLFIRSGQGKQEFMNEVKLPNSGFQGTSCKQKKYNSKNSKQAKGVKGIGG